MVIHQANPHAPVVEALVLPKVQGLSLETDDPQVNPVLARIQPFPMRGEGVQIKIFKTTQGVIMRADHVVRDFLEDAHRELGEVVKGGSGSHTAIGFTSQYCPKIDSVRLDGLFNRATLFLEEHSSARFDGLTPSLMVRSVASEGLKLFEHLRVSLGATLSNERSMETERQALLAELIEMRGKLRSLIHHFDASMLAISAHLHEDKDDTYPSDGDGPRAA